MAQRQMTRPLGQLVQAAEAIGQGDYSVRPQTIARNSELTILASAISRMAADIEERVTELALARDAATGVIGRPHAAATAALRSRMAPVRPAGSPA